MRVDGGTDTDISGATASSYVLDIADEGKTVRVKVSFTDNNRNAETVVSDASAVVGSAPNRPAQFSAATASREVEENTPAGQDIGTAISATDLDNDTLTYSIRGGSTVFEIDASSGQLQTMGALNYEGPTRSYSVVVEVTDNKDIDGVADMVIDDEIQVTITIEDVNEPAIISGPQTVDWPENTAGTIKTYTARDPDLGDQVFLTLIAGRDSDSFDFSNGRLSFKSEALPDFERRSSHQIELGADDDDDPGTPYDTTSVVTINIRDVDEPPVISFSAHANVATDGNALSLNEDYRDRIAAFRASDPERAPGLTYQWSVVGTDAGDFAVTTATDTRSAQLSFAASLDYDRPADSNSDNTYSITVQATDIPMEDTENGTPRPLTSRIALTVTVTLVPTTARPIIRGDVEPSIEEGGATLVGTYTATGRRRDDFIVWQPLEGNLKGNDADQFTFTSTGSTGRLALRATPNYESPTDFPGDNSYNVTLAARVGNDTVRRAVVVKITNKDEAGEIRISSLQPVVNVDLTATLSDIDRVVSAVWTWERATSRSGPWTALTGATGSATESTYTPGETDLNRYLRVTATYTDGHGMGKTLSDTLEQRVALETVVGDHQPEFIERLQPRSVLESAGPNAPVGAPVTATDSDGDDLTYTLRNDRGYFTIDAHGSTAGQIRVAPGATLDHETHREVVVSVDAADLSTASDTIRVTITIEDVNEAPHGVSDLVFSPEDEPVTIRVLENDTDPDDDELTVNIVRQPVNGTLTVDDPVNPGDRPTVTYTPREENFNGADSFTYKAQDTGNLLSVETTVAVIVDAVNDPPTFVESMPTRLVSESAQAGDAVGAPVTATDIEGQPVTYSLSGEEASKFTIHVGSGQITVAGGVTFDITMEPTYTVTVTATDSERAPRRKSASVEVTISVTTNAAPTFPITLFAGGQTGLSVRENAGAGTVVGLAPEATDPESGTLTYSLAVDGFTTDPPFEIDPSSRQIQVVRGAVLDHEDQDTYSVTVTAEDDFTLTRAATFDITIDDVNEPPVAVADSAVTTQEDTAVTFGALVNDPDVGDTLTVTITTQPRRGRVVVDTNTQMLTYTPADNDHGTYTFTYTGQGRREAHHPPHTGHDHR